MALTLLVVTLCAVSSWSPTLARLMPAPRCTLARVGAVAEYRGGCARGMPLQGACHAGCLHRRLVSEYRDSRDAWEAGRETGDSMRLEDDEYRAQNPPPTFKAWLAAGRRR